jgi:hypothetical protein
VNEYLERNADKHEAQEVNEEAGNVGTQMSPLRRPRRS